MRAKILIVDDSAASLMWHKLALKGGQYDLVTATDGADAVAVAGKELPDLILMDVLMPDMTGLEACRAIRAIPALRYVPVVMASTLSELKTLGSEVVSECSDYVVKPVDRAELLGKIERCLGVRRAAA